MNATFIQSSSFCEAKCESPDKQRIFPHFILLFSFALSLYQSISTCIIVLLFLKKVQTQTRFLCNLPNFKNTSQLPRFLYPFKQKSQPRIDMHSQLSLSNSLYQISSLRQSLCRYHDAYIYYQMIPIQLLHKLLREPLLNRSLLL